MNWELTTKKLDVLKDSQQIAFIQRSLELQIHGAPPNGWFDTPRGRYELSHQGENRCEGEPGAAGWVEIEWLAIGDNNLYKLIHVNNGFMLIMV